MPARTGIDSQPNPNCYVCGTSGKPLYQGLTDRLFNAPGKWNLTHCPNTQCGLVWLDPMPLQTDIGKAYQHYYTHQANEPTESSRPTKIYQAIKTAYWARRYGYPPANTGWFDKMLGLLAYLHPGRREDIDFNVMYLSKQAENRLLEVGCGHGQLLKRMADLGWQVTGIDFDPAAIQQAKNKGLSAQLGDLADQQFAAHRFDVVIMSHVIEHIPDPASLLQECYRILAPGGKLVIVTPNIKSWGHRLYGKHWRGLEPPRHLHLFTRTSLHRLVETAQFQIVACRSSARARGLLLESRDLQYRGHVRTRFPLHLRLWAELMELAEWVRLRIDREAGEELVIIATKPYADK